MSYCNRDGDYRTTQLHMPIRENLLITISMPSKFDGSGWANTQSQKLYNHIIR